MRFFIRLSLSFFLVAIVLVAFAFMFGPHRYSQTTHDQQHNTGYLNPSVDPLPEPHKGANP